MNQKINLKYDPNSLCPRMPIDDAIRMGFLPADVGRHGNALCISNEFLQDMMSHRKLLYSVRTGPITETEIAEWRQEDEQVRSTNFQDRKLRLLELGFVIETNETNE